MIEWGKIGDGILLLKHDIAKIDTRKKSHHLYNRYFGLYDATQNKRISPPKGVPLINFGDKSISLPPRLQAGIQYLQGGWASSFSLALDFINRTSENEEHHYTLSWEPYFFFSRSADAKMNVDRNSFLSFKYCYYILSSAKSRNIEFYRGIGFGYLLKNKGTWFDRRTLKVIGPGLQTRNVIVEPEVYFHDLFKDVVPSVKLSVFFQGGT